MSLSFAGLDGNPYFSAGFGLTLLGAGLALARKGYVSAMVQARKLFTVTMEVTCKDRSYPWVLQWLNSQAGASPMKQHITVETAVRQRPNGSLSSAFDFMPSPGTHVVRYLGRWLLVERTRETKSLDITSGLPWETLKLTTIGRDVSFFETFLRDAQVSAAAREEGHTLVYTSYGTDWRQFGPPRRKRPLSSVVLDEGIKESIVDDVQLFIGSAKWYINRGIPYRRGYLLHGSPGSGKSSFIVALAGHINYNICIVNLNDRGLTDDRLAHSLSVVPPQSIILLEDVDAAFRPNRDSNDKFAPNVTFSGLLNTLDGVVAGEERLLFMTTNHIERLDPALIRPGRADVICEIGPATPSQARRLFINFFPEAKTEAGEFGCAVGGHDVSMAALQGFLMLHRDRPAAAVEGVADWLVARDGKLEVTRCTV